MDTTNFQPVRVRPLERSEIPADPPEGVDEFHYFGAAQRAFSKNVQHFAGRQRRVALISESPIEGVGDNDFGGDIHRSAVKNLIAPDGRPFGWGPVFQYLSIGPYHIAECFSQQPSNVPDDEWEAGLDESGLKIEYHCYVNRKSIGRCAYSLDAALVAAIAYVHDGINTRADGYFLRMIGAQ